MKPRLLIRQHHSIERLLQALRTEPHRGGGLRAHLLNDLSIHLAIELDVLYPAIRSAGIAATDVLLLERARELLGVVAEGPSAGATFCDGVEELSAVFERHARAQETGLFPTCTERLEPATFRQIMEDVELVSFRLASSARLQPGSRTDYGVP
jgi:hypothetical protein